MDSGSALGSPADEAPGHGSAEAVPRASTAQASVGNETPALKNQQNIRCRRGLVLRLMRSVSRFFRNLLGKKKGEEGVDVIPVVPFSALGSAGSNDEDKTEPQSVVQKPAGSLCAGDFSAGSYFPRPPISALGGQADMAGGHARLGDSGKMVRVVAWLNDSQEEYSTDDDAEGVTLADNATKVDVEVQLSEVNCHSSLPWPPSALSEEEDEQPTTLFRPDEGCCLMNEVEEMSNGGILSMNGVRRALGVRQRVSHVKCEAIEVPGHSSLGWGVCACVAHGRSVTVTKSLFK